MSNDSARSDIRTNGMVKRFNSRISEIIAQIRFKSAQELQTTLTHYLAAYNYRIPQRAPDPTYHLFRHSSNGGPESLNSSSSRYMNSRDLTLNI